MQTGARVQAYPLLPAQHCYAAPRQERDSTGQLQRPSAVAMSQGHTRGHRKGQTSNTCAESCGIRQRPMASVGGKEERHSTVLSRVLFP